MPLENLFAVTASHEEQHSLSTHRPASSSRAVESTKQRSLPSFSLSSCLSLSLAVLFYLELSPFLSGTTAIFPLRYAHKYALSIRVTARTRSAEREWENQERKRWTLSIFNFVVIARRLDSLEAANVISAWIWRERNIFDPFRRIFNMLCYILLPLTYNKSILANVNNLWEIVD